MAEKEELDLDAKQGSNKKMIIIIAVLGLLLVGASVALTIMLIGGDKGGEEEVVEEPTLAQPIYLPLDKMVINFTEKGPARFLQVEMQVMARDQLVLDAVTAHMPVIRNDLLVLLGGVKYDEVATLEGKDALRTQLLEHIQAILAEHAEIQEGLEAVYFTSFVMQ